MHGYRSTIELPDLYISDNFENITSDTLEKDFQVIPDHEGLDYPSDLDNDQLRPEYSSESPDREAGDELKIRVSNPDNNNLSQHFQAEQYSSGAAITPLYEGATVTLLEAVAKHLLWLTEHLGTSKKALTDILYMQHHSILPKGNLLPDSYQAALKIVNSFLVTPLVFDVCPHSLAGQTLYQMLILS